MMILIKIIYPMTYTYKLLGAETIEVFPLVMSASTVRDLTVDLSSRRDFRWCFDKDYRVDHFDHKQNHHPSFGMISFSVSIDQFRCP